MNRDRTSFLVQWLHSNTRKPLVIRGARQTGKTWLIRDLAQSEKQNLIELNFEKRPDFVSLFTKFNLYLTKGYLKTLLHQSESNLLYSRQDLPS